MNKGGLQQHGKSKSHGFERDEYLTDGILWRTGSTRKKISLDSILWRRQTLGGTSVTPSTLSSQLSSVAWNQDRMHNLILATGPGTPASILYAANLRQRAGNRSQQLNDNEDDDDEDDDNDDDGDDDNNAHFTWTRLGNRPFGDLEDDDDSEDEDDEDSDEDMVRGDMEDMTDSLERQAREEGSPDIDSQSEAIENDQENDEEQHSNALLCVLSAAGPARASGNPGDRRTASQPHRPRSSQNNGGAHNDTRILWKPDLRHGGCINTACWMSVPWRLAAPTGMAASQNSNNVASLVEDEWGGLELCPTQLATSGDDRVVKLWDARNAMGTASPLPGGWDTFCPLSTTQRPLGFQAAWKKHYENNNSRCGNSAAGSAVAGSIIPLATVATGHRGNVFDVTPLPHQPGKLLTCAADGYLRLVDVHAQSSSVIIDPLQSYGDEHSFLPHSGLAFSHTLLNAQTGLLCSDRGLHLFDLRLSPREQARESLLADASSAANTDMSLDSFSSLRCCKACAVWRPSAAETESHYVFAGGSSAIVHLFDLRVDGSRRQVVESFKPRFIRETGDVSVSGLDVSKDGKELLVSYESDQIYAFPIMGSSSPAGPTLDDIESLAATSNSRTPVADAIAYGGHLNRFTFLKNARYAGPHDEYICTGSDSGHAWIMERGTGTIVSLMSADASTCNGVVPHPSLPFFITYGIDSTARIWRATTPVDPYVNDSREGRAICAQNEKVELSPVTQCPKVVQMLCSLFKYAPGILPDFIATRREIATSGKFSAPNRRGMVDYDSPRIGNAYRSLQSILRSNRYECYRTAQTEMSIPIDEYGLRPLSVRVSLCRLRQQSQRLGVSFSLKNHQPWNFRNVRDTHPADLVPDYPSDWILLDERMNPNALKLDKWHLNWNDCSDYLLTRNDCSSHDLLIEFTEQEERRCSLLDDPPVWLRSFKSSGKDDFAWPVRNTTMNSLDQPRLDESAPDPTGRARRTAYGMDDDEDEDNYDDYAPVVFTEGAKTRSRRCLYETALLLKEGGNVAMKDGNLDTAARRYDKSIQYCSVAFLRYREGNGELAHLKQGLCDEAGKRVDSLPVVWSPLLRVLITARLNMSLLLLKPRFGAVADASMHAVEALRLLSPFTVRPGAVIVADEEKNNEERIIHEEEPEETYKQARVLQSKAYFRWGSAEMEQGDWSAAVDAFQASLRCSDQPDSLVTRRLQEAKIKRNSKKKRDRKRFEVAISEEVSNDTLSQGS